MEKRKEKKRKRTEFSESGKLKNSRNSKTDRDRNANRKEIIEKKKAVDEVIKAASAEKDPISAFPAFRFYSRDDLSVYLESGRGDKLSSSVKKYIQNLLKVNMEEHYGSQWPTEEKVKRREMVSPAARYIFVYQTLNASACESPTISEVERTFTNKGPMVGFVHYRFVIEEGIPVLYVYELQLESCVQGKGLGKFLMQLVEIIAEKNNMAAMLLSTQTSNWGAMNFRTGNLRLLEDSWDLDNPSDAHSSPDVANDVTALAVPSQKKKRTRGATQLHRITRLQKKGRKIVLEFDNKGNALGREGDDLQSYIGTLVRKYIPINIINWKEVPESLKDKIWTEITAIFHIDESRKKAQLVAAGEKWRKFKHYLKNNFVKTREDDPLINVRPPEILERYENIDQGQWEDFVSQRLTEEFKRQSAEQSARRKKYECEHKLSRKGYSKLEREMQKESGSEAQIDRSVLWMRARQGKNGEYKNEAIRTVVDKIDSLSKQVKQGLFRPEGKVDILSAALGTPEHPGRVRAQPQFVRQKNYFESTLRSKASRDVEFAELRANVTKLMTSIEQLTREVYSQKVSGPTPDPNLGVAPPAFEITVHRVVQQQGDPNIEGIGEYNLCILALEKTDNVVAFGKAYLGCGPDTLLHGSLLGHGNLRVSIDVPIQPEAELPIPTEEFQTLQDARGGHVAWPQNLVLFVTKDPPTKEHLNKPTLTETEPSQCQSLVPEPQTSPVKKNKRNTVETTLTQKGNTPLKTRRGRKRRF